MAVIEKLENLKEKALSTGNKDLITQVGEVIGLYKAYELTSYTNILDEVLGRLCDFSEELINKNPVLNGKKINKVSDKCVDFMDFYLYLEDKGKSVNTCNNYVRTLNRVKRDKQFNINSMEEFNSKVDELLAHYKGNDESYHNAHISALQQYKQFLEHHNNTVTTNSEKITH